MRWVALFALLASQHLTGGGNVTEDATRVPSSRGAASGVALVAANAFQAVDATSLVLTLSSVFANYTLDFGEVNDMASSDGCGLASAAVHTYSAPGMFETTLSDAGARQAIQACSSNGTWSPAATASVAFSVAGLAPAMTLSGSVNTPLQLSSTVQVDVVNSSDLSVVCPSAVAYSSQFECTLTSYRKEVSAVVDFGDGTKRNFSIGDSQPGAVTVGWKSPYYDVSQGAAGSASPSNSTASRRFVIPDDGKLFAWQFTSDVAGACEFVIFRPQCSNTTAYCYKVDKCIPASLNCATYDRTSGAAVCSATPGQAAAASFSLSRRACNSSSTTASSNAIVPQVANFSAVGTYYVQATSAGCSYQRLPNPATVLQGDSVALNTNNCSVRRDVYYGSATPNSSGYDFHLQAHIVRPVTMKLKHTYENCLRYTINASLPAYAKEGATEVVSVLPYIYSLSFVVQPTTYQATADVVSFTVSIVRDPCVAPASFNLTMGSDYQRFLTTNSTNVSNSQAFMRMDQYLVTACAANEISQACAMITLVVQDRIAGLVCNFSRELHPPATAPMDCSVANGSDVSWRISFDGGLPTYYNASYALGQNVSIRAARNRLSAKLTYAQCAENASYEVIAFNMVSNASFGGSFVSLVLLSGVTIDAIPPLPFGESVNVSLRIASGCHFNISSTLDQTAVPLFRQPPSTAIGAVLQDSLSSAAYQTIGRHSLTVSVSNALSNFTAAAAFDVDYPLTGLKLIPSPSVVTAGVDAVRFQLNIELGSRFSAYIDYGDGTGDRQDIGGSITSGFIAFSHTYARDGNFTVAVTVTNSLGSANASCQIASYFRAAGLSLALDAQNQTGDGNFATLLASAAGYVAVRTLTLYLNTSVVPRVTRATYALDYGDGSPPLAAPFDLAPTPTAAPASATLQPIASWTQAFTHEGQFAIRLVVSNPVSSASLTQWHTVFSQVTAVSISATYVSTVTGDVAFGNDDKGHEQGAPSWPLASYFPLDVPINFTLAIGRGNFLTYNWDFGDNSNVSTEFPASVVHQYASPGNYAVTLNVSNNVSYDAFTARIIVQRSVADLQTRNSNGTNVQLLNTPVKLEFDLGTNGTDACYVVDLDSGMISGQPRYVMFGVKATCDLVFDPYTATTKAVPPPGAAIARIDEGAPYTVNYVIKGMKSIRLTGANMISTYTHNFVFYASDLLCGPPVTNAKTPNDCNNGYTCVKGVRQVYKSVAAIVKGTFTIDCKLPTSYQMFSWSIFQVLATHGHPEVPVEVPGIGDLSGQFLNALTVPPQALGVGRYAFYVNVSVTTTPPMSSVDRTVLDIVQSPLVTGLPGGPSVRLGSKNVTFDALSMTYDPDSTNGSSPADYRFVWLCRRQCETYPSYDASGNVIAPMTSTCSDYANASLWAGNASTDRGCFYDDGYDSSGSFTDSAAGQVTVDLSGSYPGTYIYVQVIAFKGPSRSASFEQAIFITAGDPPIVQLLCATNCLAKYVSDQSYAASATVAAPQPNQKYCARWYLQNVTDLTNVSNAPFIPIGRLAPYVNNPNMVGFGFSLSGSAFSAADNIIHLAVQVRVWPVGSQTDCNANATYSSSPTYGVAFQYLTVNDVPAFKPGACAATPTTGESFGTQYVIGCSLKACGDASGDLIRYDVAWRQTALDQWIWYFRGLTVDFKTVQTQLPQGDASNNYTSTLLIVCFDIYGSSTNTSLQVQIMPTTAKSTSILTNLLQGQLKNAGGIAANTMMKVISASSFMSQCNTTESEVAAKVQEMTEFITASLSKYPQTSVSDVVTIQTALQLLTSNAGGLTMAAATSAVAASANSVAVISSSSSLRDASATSSSVLSTIGNLLTYTSASNGNASGNTASGVSANNDSVQLIKAALGVIGQIGAAVNRYAAPGGQEVAVETAKVTLQCGSAIVQGSLQGASGALSVDGSAFDQPANSSGVLISHRAVSTANPFVSSDPNSENVTSLTLGLQLIDANSSIAKIKPSNQSAGVSVSLVHNTPAPVTTVPVHVSSSNESSFVAYKVTLQPNSSFFLDTRPLVESALVGLKAYGPAPSVNKTVTANRTVLFEVFMAISRQPLVNDYDYMCSVYVQDSAVGSWTVSASNVSYWPGSEVCSLTGQQLPRGTTVNVYYAIRSQVPLGDQAATSTGNSTAVSRARRAAGAPVGSNSTNSSTSVKSYSATCSMLSESTGQWTSAGCQAGLQSTPSVTHCQCSNDALLESSPSSAAAAANGKSTGDGNQFKYFFGASIYVPMNTINLAQLSWQSLEDTPIVFAVMISACCLYLCCCVWSVRQDRDDELKAMSIMLLDNHPLDEYLYEVAVATGSNVGAGTTSKVCITFVGSASETPPRYIAGEDQHISFRRGAVDSFVMAVPEPLGDVTHLRVWLCYEGQSPSWWLASVTLTDIQTAQRWTFLCNAWLSYEKGEGLVDRILPSASSGDLSQGGYLFKKKAQAGFMDSHPWFSVLGRPRRSSFSRTQRLTCCLALLFTMMAANVLFYGQKPVAISEVYNVGPLKFTLPQIYKGVWVSLIVLPINVLIATIFRKSAKRRPRLAGKRTVDQCKAKSKARTPERRSQRALGDRLHRQRRRGKVLLPWWCVYVGYALSLATAVASFLVTVQIGTAFGEDKAEQWLQSFFTSFFASLLFVEPSKIVVIAMLYVIFIRQPIDHGPDPTQLRVLEGRSHIGMAGPFYNPAFKYIALEDSLRKFKVPPQPADTEFLRASRLKARKEEAILKTTKDIVIYLIYITVLFVIVYGATDPLSSVQYSNLKTMLAHGNVITGARQLATRGKEHFSTTRMTKCPAHLQGCIVVRSQDDFWKWVSRTLIPTLYGEYVDQKDIRYPYRYIADHVNVLLGSARLRQVRTKSGPCPREVKSVNSDVQCTGRFDDATEERGMFKRMWTSGNLSDTSSDDRGFLWNSSAELGSRYYVGSVGQYPGSGYTVELGTSAAEARDTVDSLVDGGWIDGQTRAVFAEFLLYNPSISAFAVAEIAFEKLTTGAMTSQFRMSLLRLDTTFGPYAFGVIASEVILFVYYVLAVKREVASLFKQKCSYFKSFSNWVELVQLLLLSAMYALLAYQFYVNSVTLKGIVAKTTGEYFGAHEAAEYTELFHDFLALVIFVAYLKFIKILAFNKIIRNMASALKYLAFPCLQLMMLVALVVLAFAMLFYGMFGSRVNDYGTIWSSMKSLLLLVLNKTHFEVLQQVAGFFGPVLCVIFIITINFFMANFLVSMLVQGLSMRVRLKGGRNSAYSFGEYFFGYLKTLLVFGYDPPPLKVKDIQESVDHIDLLESKIQTLSNSLDMYAYAASTAEDNRRTRLLQQRATNKEGGVKTICAS